MAFKFQLSSSSSFRDFRGSQIYVMGPCAPCTPPSGKIFAPEANGVLNFNFLALVCSEMLGGPTFTLGGHTPLGRPLAEKYFYPKRVLHNI